MRSTEPAPLPVIVNRSGGTAGRMGDDLEPKLREAFAAVGCGIDLQLCEGEAIGQAIERSAGAPVVAIGGGDGTLGQAAGKLAQAGSALGILPLGTRNHLALQLGIPADLTAAARIIAGSHRSRIDLARAGDRVFSNNASIGIYTHLVRQRDQRSGPKWLATIPAAFDVLRHWRAQHFLLSIDGTTRKTKTPLLFIGNNRYTLDAGSVGTRDSLNDGRLSLYSVAAQTPFQLLGFAVRAALGRANPDRDFAELADAAEVVVGGRTMIDVAFDGEVERMALPLTFAILAQALEVMTPEPADPGKPAQTDAALSLAARASLPYRRDV